MLAVKFQQYGKPIEIDIDPTKTIRGVGFYFDKQFHICGLRLYAENGDYIVNQKWSEINDGSWSTEKVPAGEQIIGMQVNTESMYSYIPRISLLCWKSDRRFKK